MAKPKLIIVESPAKIKTLKKFLGKDYIFESSIGHIRDLPEKEFGIDVDNDFSPTYVTLPDKKDVIKKLKAAAKLAETVYLSPDPDREGEAIAWHIASILPKGTHIKRVAFHSITKDAVTNALKEPRDINQALVDAQQARRLLDRIVGYKISPILTRKIRKGKDGISAGRVQSVALKLVVQREQEIEKFKPIEYWLLKSFLTKEKQTFEANLYSVEGKKVDKEEGKGKKSFVIGDEKTAIEVAEKLKKASYKVGNVDKKEKKRNPVPPFITSTLQQEASRHYTYPVSRTMNIAQGLYEGIDMGNEGTEGLITYMRTDSVQVAPEALTAARKFIEKKYGKDFVPTKPNLYSSKKSAQEAHEAIRPTNLNHPPEAIKAHLTIDQFKIYSLIWKRFIASQMKPAIYDTVAAQILTDQNVELRVTGSVLKFPGFLSVYEEKTDAIPEEDGKEKTLPPLVENDVLKLSEVTQKQSFTQPPPRFTEASLVKELEKCGIGRPSTYASIMNKIQSRSYTEKEKNTLKPTELGRIITQMLDENFPVILNIGFTSAMEDDLELIAENKVEWKGLIKEFWSEFLPMVEKAEKEALVPKIDTDIKCPNCGKPVQKIWSRNKYFYGCSNYPECDYTASTESYHFDKSNYDAKFDWEQKCPKCKGDMVLRHGRFGAFLGCGNYPKCQGIVNIPKEGEILLQPEERPECPALGCDGKIMMRRARTGKIFFSCSNFPDCNVIVNALPELEEKYDAHHPKTPYEKKARGVRGGPKRAFPLSKELQAIVKDKELPRGEVLKKVWAYIKEKNLQDPKNKRRICPDKKLEALFGSKEPIDMMKLSGIIGKHLIK